MDPLATAIEDSLFRYDQVSRDGMYALYTQTHKPSGVVRFEVIHIRTHKAHTWPNGTTTPACESYPTARMWGQWGFTFFHLDAAQAKLAQLLEQQEVAPCP